MVSEGSVHGNLAICFWAHVEAKPEGGGCYLIVERKQKVRKGLETRYSLQRYALWHLLPSVRPYLLKFPEPLKMAPPTRTMCST
jgi:hypothetical protein